MIFLRDTASDVAVEVLDPTTYITNYNMHSKSASSTPPKVNLRLNVYIKTTRLHFAGPLAEKIKAQSLYGISRSASATQDFMSVYSNSSSFIEIQV